MIKFIKDWFDNRKKEKIKKQEVRKVSDDIANSILDRLNSLFFRIEKINKITSGYSYLDSIKIQKFMICVDEAGSYPEYKLFVDDDIIDSDQNICEKIYNFCESKYDEYTPERIKITLEKLDVV